MKKRYKFDPDYAMHGGETLKETMEARNISVQNMSDRTGLSESVIEKLLTHDICINKEIAIILEEVLGVPKTLWLNLEKFYHEMYDKGDKL
jgi:plasmid maintenance system antidote protein VapI